MTGRWDWWRVSSCRALWTGRGEGSPQPQSVKGCHWWVVSMCELQRRKWNWVERRVKHGYREDVIPIAQVKESGWQFIIIIFNFLFGDTCRFTCLCKKSYREVLHSLHPVFPNSNVLCNYSTISELRNWHSTDPAQISPVLQVLLCVYLLLCVFFLYV